MLVSLFYAWIFHLALSAQARSNVGRQRHYVAAVFEHEAFFIPHIKQATRQQALEIMMINIDIYQDQARLAKARQAQIIVFPEDGLYGFEYTRNSIYPFLENIPNPYELQRPWNPCLDPLRY